MQTQHLQFLMLSPEILDSLLSLKIPDNEAHLISPNAEWIAEAAFMSKSITYGLFWRKQPVGLISLIDPRLLDQDDDNDHFQGDFLYVWRLMIDQHHRRQGYGRSAIRFAQSYAQLIGQKGVSLTTMDRASLNALPLYQSMGFEPTGRRLDDEIELIWQPL
ncbi:GNAT family N-acetyltransferase [Neptunomonas antarctica]|uniref:Diamine N-acetyltransferase n=1 Tax=Neptunomonas antarctica TaxID=619304 RepID=A0A1N7KX77_9GAMM|nr:GNAT family N-acetyltransferase [Neptunomonas antarctica]SIS66086.1 diamine N-acetyltransferase [Neptunomonas antarctica]